MTRTRLFALRMAGVIAALAVPLANGDARWRKPITIADISGAPSLATDANAGCPDLKYNQTLQDIALRHRRASSHSRRPDQINLKGAYGGEVVYFIGTGDPDAPTLTNAYRNGAGGAIGDCSLTDFGVAFIRDEAYDVDDYGPDFVGLVFGKKATVTPPSGPGAPGGQGQEQKQVPPTKCGPNDVETEVPAGSQCTPKPAVACPPGGPQAEVPAGQTCPPPANAVKVTFDRGFGTWTVNVKNTAGIGGSCTYTATSQVGLPGADRPSTSRPTGRRAFDVCWLRLASTTS